LSDISESLACVEVFKVLSSPGLVRLRLSVVSVLERDKESAMLSSDHHGIHLLVGGRASPLAADIKEYRALSIFA